MSDDHIDVLDADKEGDDHPTDQETSVHPYGTKYQDQGTENSKESIKDGILDERSNADIFSIAIVHIAISKPEDIENGGDDGDAQLNNSDNEHRLLQRYPKHRPKARLPSTHFPSN
eukprot:GFUD01110581.1.p2 GENE.GFUD01110581.1~~GFUD01110581.1.p2  ORF type:complete len:116 (-),score=29.14 GFUD01110581.1:25-372(-)